MKTKKKLFNEATHSNKIIPAVIKKRAHPEYFHKLIFIDVLNKRLCVFFRAVGSTKILYYGCNVNGWAVRTLRECSAGTDCGCDLKFKEGGRCDVKLFLFVAFTCEDWVKFSMEEIATVVTLNNLDRLQMIDQVPVSATVSRSLKIYLKPLEQC